MILFSDSNGDHLPELIDSVGSVAEQTAMGAEHSAPSTHPHTSSSKVLAPGLGGSGIIIADCSF